MQDTIAIAIDGPAAAGKSTVAKIVAKELSYVYIDTGAMYRALTLKALRNGARLNVEEDMHQLLMTTTIDLQQTGDGQRVLLDTEDVSLDVRSQEVTTQVSYVAVHGKVREEMVNRQRQLAEKKGVVMDGRDIGTHVIPDAEVKVFLIASVSERAERRHKENMEKGFPSDMEQLKEEIRMRDKIDSEREVSPLVKADDAIEVDTTSLTIDEVANRILSIVQDQLK
ncbi:cytidylate kinase [Pontibacillus halophilus JSM 076056 = DSM 19796]|uniref:Cytidylate kinase n=1 Tax=Pontibacillus halophilus JSM 076056 = DSM 19796 TaxID=1385510 RepID=A0A0A5GG05_9BACI|nr:(d)CMP kinase [Pontibacillus halophilus]KGX92181.1 cytidylate kinase [Pontibacillus halophilus JSM 076056 = DSM 19796]